MTEERLFATTAKGLEPLLATELRQLGMAGVTPQRGGVAFAGGRDAGYRACLQLRTANRVLRPLGQMTVVTAEDLYRETAALPWEDYLSPAMTLAVDANLRDSALTHSQFVALKAKDAIVDRLRDKCGRRPNIDPKRADLRVNLHLVANQCTVSLDLAGRGLHRRGYRHDASLAPLRETLAAGLLLASGWNRQSPLVDPMCGSGTLPLEAGLLASNTPPGLLDPDFSFCRWPDFDAAAWQQILDEARTGCRPLADGQILGADRDRKAVTMARRNAGRLAFADAIDWQTVDFASLRPPQRRGLLICNPPYGERLGDQEKLAPLYQQLGDNLKQHWTGWTAWIFTGNLPLAKRIGLKPNKRIVLYNGAIECRLLKFELY
ncbi:MAG: THUMP domain-containing protein [Desulfuromonadales bacterium]|nr:THUMP domain-containing protein [Desulfuromonadales bacterium]